MLEMRLPETLKKPGADPILDFNLDMDDDVVKLVWTGTNVRTPPYRDQGKGSIPISFMCVDGPSSQVLTVKKAIHENPSHLSCK